MSLLAVLYDVHGNLPALEAVLTEARAAGARRFALGGDYGAFGGWPLETVTLLRELPDAVWIRGNAERWLVEPPADRPELAPALDAARQSLAGELGRLVALPEAVELEGALLCHASPESDVETFGREPRPEDERRLAGVRGRVVVFGHSHLQFRRSGPRGTELVNPGSVGLPFDGDGRAAWAIGPSADDLEFRRTEYDVGRALVRLREIAAPWALAVADRLVRASV